MSNGKYIAKKLYRKSTIDAFQARVDLLGVKDSYDVTKLLNIRLVTSFFLFFVLLYTAKWSYFTAPLITFGYYYLLPKLVIDKKIEKRRVHLDKEALYFFEVLTLSLESGRNLKTAIEITASNIDSDLSDEFKQVIREVNLGKSLNEALDDIKKRIPSLTINNIILNIKESNIFGNNIIETMYNQIDYIREKRILEAKEIINKMPVKVSVVSVVFILPMLLLLILAPVIINYIGG